MASFTDGNRKTYLPNGAVDLSGKVYYIVKETALGVCDLASSATDFIVGTINSIERKGQEVEVFSRNGSSTHKVILGGTVAIGDHLTSNASGQAIVTTTVGNQVLGRAAMAGVSGDIIEYLPFGFGKYS